MMARNQTLRLLAPTGMFAATVAAGYAIGRGSWVPGALLGLAFIAACTLRARGILVSALVASLVLGSGINMDLKTAVYYPRFLLLGALLAASLLHPTLRTSRHSVGVGKIAVGLVTFAMLSALWSVDPSVTLGRAISLLVLLLVALACVRRVWITDTEVERDLAVVTSTLGVAFMLGLGSGAAGAEWAEAGNRFRGVLENPNTVGVAAAFVLPVSLGFFGARHGWQSLWWAAVAAATLLSLVLSQSRGGLLAAGSGVLVLMVLSRAVRHPLAVVVLCSVGATLLVGLGSTAVRVPEPLEAVVGRFEEDATGEGRLAAWSLAFALAGERPVTGWGFGTSEAIFGPRAHAIRNVFQGGLVHNSYLQVFLELGAVGLTLLILLLSSVLRLGWPSPRAHPIRAGVYGALIAGSVSAVAESTLFSVGSVFGFAFWLLAAASVHFRWLALRPEEDLVSGPSASRLAAPLAGIRWRRT